MGFSASDADRPLQVADASVWINLAATERCADIVTALDARIAIADIALAELERGRKNGHGAFECIAPLIRSGHVIVVKVGEEGDELFLSLVAGSTADTLDDGEAATLVAAINLKGVAVIDERKATAIAERCFPTLVVRSTADLLLDTIPDDGDKAGPLPEALFGALTGARMRVPPRLYARVVDILGPERTKLCHSLPSHLRLAQSSDDQAPKTNNKYERQ